MTQAVLSRAPGRLGILLVAGHQATALLFIDVSAALGILFARVTAAQVTSNGEVVDLGTIVLDDTAVQVASVYPADGATDVLPTRSIRLTFSDPILSTTGITLWNGAQQHVVAWAPAADGLSATSIGTLPEGADLTVLVTTALTDVFLRHPSQSFSSHFRTADLSPPHVTAISPTNYQTQVPVTTPIVITFNEVIGDATNCYILNVLRPSGRLPGSCRSPHFD